MEFNSNRSARFLLPLISLIAAGCSQNTKDALSISERPPVVSNQDTDYFGHSHSHRFNHKKLNRGSFETVWDRMLSLFALPEINHPRIDREVDFYLQHPNALVTIQQRAAPYMHHILDEIEAKNIPGEFALLPVVESAFVPDAYSKSDASGLWQFIPSTGKLFGLKQNSWYDGRRDIYASTKAATTYLKQLCETFDGDWLLALASYNWGKGNVRKSIEKNQDQNLPSDYWSIDMPEETFNYVPRLLAVAKIFANAEEYNVPLLHIPNKPYFEVVDIKAPIDLNKAANLANTPLNEFLKLNPGFNRWCTAPNGPHRLLIPVKKAQIFKKNLAQLPYEKRVSFPERLDETQQSARAEHHSANRHRQTIAYSRHKVRRGETLSSIARKNGTTVTEIRKLNQLARNTINAGVTLKIPSTKTSADLNLIAKSSRVGSLRNIAQKIHVVKKGDTFWNISQRYGVTPNDVAGWNKISLKSALIPGQKIAIKSRDAQLAYASSALQLIRYTVKSGDSLTQISRKFNVSISDLRKSNSEILAKGLHPGQKLKILIDGNQPTT